MSAIDYNLDVVRGAFVKLEARAAAAEASTLAAETRASAAEAALATGPTLTIGTPAPINEGDSGTTAFLFPVFLSRNGTTSVIAYAWAVSGSGANPANAADFGGTFPSGSGTFAPGETSKTIVVLIAGDASVESTENFIVTVTPTILLSAASSEGTITNDDAQKVTPFFGSTSSTWGDTTPIFGATA